MTRAIQITADSTADLSPEIAEKYGIKLIPLYVTLGDATYRDGVDIDAEKVFAHYARTGALPKTAAVTEADYYDVFKAADEAGMDVVHINISSEFSACHQNARLAAEEAGNAWAVDSRNLSTGSGHLALMAAELAAMGKSAPMIAEYLRGVTERVEASFVVDTLEFLHKGGRCSSVTALGANLLRLKPCIEVTDGKMRVGKKYRGAFAKCLAEYVDDKLAGRDDLELARVFVTHAGVDPKTVADVVKQVKKLQPFKEVLVTEAGCTVSGHCGPNTLGVLYIRKKK